MKIISTSLFFAAIANQASACTYLSLEGEDGTMVASRTMEWGAFDINAEVLFAPAGTDFKSMKVGFASKYTTQDKEGKQWQSDYDVMGISAMRGVLEEPMFGDGINSEGLSVSLLYHPGTSKYPLFKKDEAENTITSLDLPAYVLSTCKSVYQAKKKLKEVNIIGKWVTPLAEVSGAHFAIADTKGHEIVVEFLDHEMVIFEDTVGVMTNSPSYDWHLNNLRNYVSLKTHDWEEFDVNGVKIAPMGYGSGLLGLPGDYTPPSRFIRAVALRELARETAGGEDTVREAIRILQAFQLPTEHSAESLGKDWDVMKYGSSLWTVAYDTKNMRMYYRTSKIPTVRVVDMNAVDFKNMTAMAFLPLDTEEDAYATEKNLERLSVTEL